MVAESAQANDTIAAMATAPGRAGVGVIRVSGPASRDLALQMLGFIPKPRFAHYGPFFAASLPATALENSGQACRAGEKQILDQGIALFFPGPHSFTGEDVLELQAHGGPVILDMLLRELVQLGARLARPGEFSERAFLNDKLDLAQAEAIADLIDSSSEQAARCALRSLQGEFSKQIHALVDAVTHLRIYVEAAIDFPEEEVDFLADGKVAAQLVQLQEQLAGILQQAKQGSLLRDGMTVVLAGRPNAGKSSLMNALAGREAAIVTPIAGTTRDVLREQIHIDGMPLHILDTAGLRDSADMVEQLGISRAWQAIEQADSVLLLLDASESDATSAETAWPAFVARLPRQMPVTLVRNKCDLTGEGLTTQAATPGLLRIVAKTGEGIDVLRQHLKTLMGFTTAEGGFIARQRHLDALQRAEKLLAQGALQLESLGAGELLAEDLRAVQEALGEITGQVRPDDLLGKIFSSFCIGK